MTKKEYHEQVRPTEDWFIAQRASEGRRGKFSVFPTHRGPNVPAAVKRAQKRAARAEYLAEKKSTKR